MQLVSTGYQNCKQGGVPLLMHNHDVYHPLCVFVHTQQLVCLAHSIKFPLMACPLDTCLRGIAVEWQCRVVIIVNAESVGDWHTYLGYGPEWHSNCRGV